MTKAWSDRFEKGLNPFIKVFNASINFDIELLNEDIEGSIAHAKMLAETKVITSKEAKLIEEGLKEILIEYHRGSFKAGVDDEDVHFAVEHRLINKIGDIGKKLHTGRSRNDQVATDLRLWLRKKIDRLDDQVKKFQLILLNQAEENLNTIIPGYTHLQRAQPVSLAHHLVAYIEMLERDRERLLDVRGRVNTCPLGAAALAGTKVPIDRYLTAKTLGFENICNNSIDAVSDRDFVVEFVSSASLIMAHLSRLSEELILWSSEEFSFVKLTDRCATGSSLMPQKKNPDVPELIRGKSGRVFGHLQALLTMIKGLPLAYNKDFQEDKEALFDTVLTVDNCLNAMTILFEEGIEFSRDSLSAAVISDFSNATDVADYLVIKGVPFREAYQLVGALVKYCLEQNILLKDLTLEKWQEFHPSVSQDIYTKLLPENVVASRTSQGGTGFRLVKEQLVVWRSKLAK
ncbi:argininosuccinate lyase [Prochlorococcus sp. MIT 1223]|uniref:argininosuccinate lyase n=1 Tax=Prochlorococcus sp. MIT 1223 TaxID=3096217 RepID=UPI002A75C14B|nr:argininosuccinate lyase [Prochlorococcus sp. MIT 1223]